MKSTLNIKQSSEPKPVPALYKYKDEKEFNLIVFIYNISNEEGQGMVVFSKDTDSHKDYHYIGSYSNEWYMPNFEIYTGSITLEND